jgi:hypothetical protein
MQDGIKRRIFNNYMTIERYTLNPGIELNLNQDPNSQTKNAMSANQAIKQVLPEGEYDVTPDVWKKFGSNRNRYNLIVKEDGTAIMRLIPVDKDVQTTIMSAGSVDSKLGGRVIQIPQDGTFLPIAGPQRGDPTFRIYEIINWVPGRSPKA